MPWWRRLFLPFLALKLGWLLSLNLLGLAFSLFPWWSLTLSGVMIGFYIINFGLYINLFKRLSAQKILSQPQLSPPPLAFTRPEETKLQTLTEQAISQKRQDWESQLIDQPTHRDLLINLGILAWWSGDTEKAQTYWATARQVDPNFPIWSEEKAD